jgi:hypothetical protein
MFTRLRGLSLALLGFLTPAAASYAPAPAPKSEPGWEELMWWLPEDTETVIVSQGPIEIPAREPEGVDFGVAAWHLATGPLMSLKDKLLLKELAGKKILTAVEGSRRFTSPANLGMMPYQGAHLVRFEPAADEALRAAFRLCQEKADRKIEVDGEPVAVFTEKHEQDVWSYLVCRPRPGVLVLATDRTYLEETLKRMGRKPDRRALPPDLPEWRQVDVTAGVWAVRHYRKESAEDDPTSPLRGQAAANVPDPAAVGFVFWYDPTGKKPAKARYLTGAADAVKIVTKGWDHPAEGLKPKVSLAAPGVVEVAGSPSDDKGGAMFLLVLLGYLGHAIYL